MTDLNEVILIGRLTRDLGNDERSFGYVQSGVARANIDIAVNRSRKQGDQWIEECSYFSVTIWGKTAENLKPYLLKGKQICVKGFLKQDRWEKDGQKLSRISIVAESVQLLGGNSDNQNGAPHFTPQNQQNGFQNQPMNNGYQNQPQNNGYQNQPMNNQQGGFVGTTANGDYSAQDFPEDIPF